MGSLTLGTESMHQELYSALGLSRTSKKVPEFPRVLSFLSLLLEKVVQKNEKIHDLTKTTETITIFHGLKSPNLSIQMYVERVYKYSKCSPSCFVLAQIYIDRFLQRTDIHLTSLNVHRLLITSVVVAAKYIDDAFFNNAYYARVGGISTVEMNKMELKLLFSLDFRLGVDLATFGKYCLQLDREASVYHVERPIQACGPKDRSEDPKSRPSLRRYSCGAV